MTFYRHTRTSGAAILSLLILMAAAWPQAAEAQRPQVDSRDVDIWSEGTRISGTLFHPKGMKETDKLPAIVMSHGWGGTRPHLNTAYASFFADAGFVVLTIDYRGWGDSDSKLVIEGKMPKPDEDGMVTVKAKAIRDLVDPFDQVQDIGHAISFIEGEPGVDPDRIGYWGSSYSGGHAVYVAAHDPRIKCFVAQVGAQDSISAVEGIWGDLGGLKWAAEQATKRARGEIDPVPQGVHQVPGLGGTPIPAKHAHYSPIAFASQVKVPALFIDAEDEDLFDRMEHGHAAYEIIKKNAPAKYETFPGNHYDIYSRHRIPARAMALEWFKEHLKGE